MTKRQPVTPRRIAEAAVLLTSDGRTSSVRELIAFLRAAEAFEAHAIATLQLLDDGPHADPVDHRDAAQDGGQGAR